MLNSPCLSFLGGSRFYQTLPWLLSVKEAGTRAMNQPEWSSLVDFLELPPVKAWVKYYSHSYSFGHVIFAVTMLLLQLRHHLTSNKK